MRATCPSCQTNYNIDDKRIPPGGAKLKCSKCQTLFPIKPGADSAPSSAAIPLPGAAAPAPSSAAIPLPGAATAPDSSSAAIPLPGAAAPAPSSAAIPLPGAAAPAPSSAAIPLPGAASAPESASAAIPLPGLTAAPARSTDFGGTEDPFGWEDESTRVAQVEVPQEAFREQWDEEEDATRAKGFTVPAEAFGDIPSADADDFSFAVPLPGNSEPPPQPFDFSDDFGAPLEQAEAVPLPASSAPAWDPAPPVDDFGEAVPLPGQSASADFAFPPPPPPAPEPFAPSSDGGYSLDFDDLPAPASPAPSDDFSLDFDDLPSPAAPPPAPAAPAPDPFDDGFGELPSPADPFAQAPVPASPPPAVDVSASFGEVDFGGPVDDLEFDPTRAPKQVDDLEADLSSPLPPPSAPQAADGLEMLSFIDDTAKDAFAGNSPKVKRFHVRRRSGKVFGPFEEGVIVKMLEDGQLLGNEDVSSDGDAWSAIGAVPPFQEAIQRLMEAPSPGTGIAEAAENLTAQQAASSAQSMERLKTLYEGRMAAVSVVDRRAGSEKVRKRLPLLIAAGVIVLIAGAGGSLGLTRYGVFGLKYLLPAKVSPGSPQFTQLQKAREAILADTFKSYTEARELTQKILASKEYPEARAAWSEAVFYLERRYAAAKPADLARARAELENIKLLGEKHPAYVKASANAALNANKPDEARLLLEDAVMRHDQDPELKFLLAQAWVLRAQDDRAAQVLEKVLARNPKSAKALHALGTLSRRKAEKLGNAGQREEANKEAQKAGYLYAKALEADPDHVISAVELAAIELLVHHDPSAGKSALDRALDEKSTQLMGPAELARARALNGVALASQFQMKEAIAEFEEALKLDKDSVFARAQLGRIYLSQHEFEKAVPLFRLASEKEPSNLDYVDGYLTVLIGTGKMQDALEILKKANAQFPDTPRLAWVEARVNDTLDKRTEAVSHYERAIKGDASLFEANLDLGRLFLRQKKVADARAQFEAALEKAPKSAAVHAGMGELALAENDVTAARSAFEQSVSLDPTLQDAQLGLSRVALLENRVEDAAVFIEKALSIDPRVKGGLLQKGLVLWRQGKLDEAVKALEEGKKLEPTNAQISITHGAVLLDKGDLALAETALISALNLDPRSAEANFYRARVKNRRAEHTQAIEAMKAALEAAPKRADYHYEMGLIYRDAKKGLEAMEEWKAAIALHPEYADAMEALGQALLDRGEFEPAIGYFEHALRVDPARARLLGMIGDAWFQATAWDKAISRYQDALKADPSLTYVFYKIGRALSESGQPAKAIGWYRKATESEPKNAMPWYFLAFLHKEKNQRRDAIAAFKRYLELRPDAPDLKEIELEIYDLEQGI